MKAFCKGLMIAIVLIYIVGMVAVLSVFAHIPWLTGFVTRLIYRYKSGNLAASIMILFSVFLAIVLLIIALSSIPKTKSVIYHNDLGKLELSRKSIEAVAYSAVREFKEVGNANASIKGNATPEKLKMHIDIEPRNASVSIEHLGEAIQKKVVDKLSSCLSINSDSVYVRVYSVKPKTETNAEKGNSKKQPRVV